MTRLDSRTTRIDMQRSDTAGPQPLLDAIEQTESLRGRRPGGCQSAVAECLDVRHPTLAGRVKVRLRRTEFQTDDFWVATLHGIAIRDGDRVLMQRPPNWDEWLVIGVIDGFAHRPELERTTAASLTLRPDEAIRIEDAAGGPLMELCQSENGPVVRLLQDDVEVETPGALSLNAKSIELKARQGNVNIAASDDVVVNGEMIHLN